MYLKELSKKEAIYERLASALGTSLHSCLCVCCMGVEITVAQSSLIPVSCGLGSIIGRNPLGELVGN